MDENERKRKRELEGDDVDDDAVSIDAPGKEKPREGLKTGKKNKKQKIDKDGKASSMQNGGDSVGLGDDDANKKKAEKRREKRERLKEKAARLKQKDKDKKARKEALKASGDSAASKPIEKTKASTKPNHTPKASVEAPSDEKDEEMVDEEDEGEPIEMPEIEEDSESGENEAEVERSPQAETEEDFIVNGASDEGMDQVDVSGLVQEQDVETQSSTANSPPPDSTFSHTSEQVAASSTSSIEATTISPEFKKPTKINIPKLDHEALKARLQARIDALRAERKADGPNGQPARTRQELIEARRKKQDARKQLKKELRKQAKGDEETAKAEAELARLRGSGSPMTGSDIFSPAATDHLNTNFAFGRVTFEDGQRFDIKGNPISKSRTKGPSDPRTALAAAENKKARLSGLDDVKRKDIETKDLWLNAKKKAHGERVKDDTSLLKKTLKRKEKQKAKSAEEWSNREEGIKKNQEIKQKKREENLMKRRDEKGGKKAKKSSSAKSSKSKQKNRAFGGFGTKGKK